MTDFGLSNNFLPGEKMMTACGSMAYSAPEMLLQEPYDGPSVDDWSLGACPLACGRVAQCMQA